MPADGPNETANNFDTVRGDLLRENAYDVFTSSLALCNIGQAFDRHLHFEGNTLVHHPFPDLQHVVKPARIPLDLFRHIRIFAIGKAAVPMLDALLTRLPRGLPYRALCTSLNRPARRNWRLHAFTAGHPIPNEQSFEAARLTLKMLRQSHSDTFVFFLLSGGGSTLLELPLDPSISLDDTVAFHQALVSSGATIHEINIVRKHFSAVKGGRLALAAPHATKLTLQIADVPLRNLDALASGPTIPDRSTVEECREVIQRYRLLDRFPASVRAFFSAAQLEETPGAKPSIPTLSPDTSPTRLASVHSAPAYPEDTQRSRFHPGTALRAIVRPAKAPEFLKDPAGFGALSLDTLLSSHDLINAARDRAQQLGFKVVIDNSCDDWPYDAAALYLVHRLAELRKRHPHVCLISSGEVTVKLNADPGTGGRNQQFVLAAALMLAGEWTGDLAGSMAGQLADAGVPLPAEAFAASGLAGGSTYAFAGSAISVFSAGTDGVDGNSPVAGAVADLSTIARARALGFDPLKTLLSFDACPLFSALGDTIITGMTSHNLRDLRLLMAVPLQPSAGWSRSRSVRRHDDDFFAHDAHDRIAE